MSADPDPDLVIPPTPPPPAALPAKNGREPVPYERFSEVAGERKALAARVAELEASAADTARLSAALDAEKGGRKAERAAWEEERALLRGGITDPEGVEVARLLFGRAPEEARAGGIAGWLDGLRAEGATVPRPLQPYLSPPGGAAAPPPGGVKPPASGAAGAQHPPAAGSVTADAIRAATQRYQRTGHPDDRASLERLLAADTAARRARA